MDATCSQLDIVAITANVLESIVAATVEGADDASQSYDLTGCIQITGASHSMVALDCSEEFARNATSIMLNVAAENATAEDLGDVVAELTNMIGGNIKSLLPGPSFLSLPSVTVGTQYQVSVPGAIRNEDVPLCTSLGGIRISLWQLDGIRPAFSLN